jgi:hypothetical protein
MTKAKRQPGADTGVLPEPGERSRTAIARAASRILERRKPFAVALEQGDKGIEVKFPHNNATGGVAHLTDTFGTASQDFAYDALGTLAATLRDSGKALPTPSALNAALALVDGLQPANELESMLAVQMAATHSLAMALVTRTRQTDGLQQMEAQGGLAVKLLRTFTLQAETLAKLRRGGGQTVRVEHVHVHAGGQAIVGNVTPGGGQV